MSPGVTMQPSALISSGGVYIFGADDDPVFHRDVAHGIQSAIRIKHAAAAGSDNLLFFPMDTSICLYLLVSAFELNVII